MTQTKTKKATKSQKAKATKPAAAKTQKDAVVQIPPGFGTGAKPMRTRAAAQTAQHGSLGMPMKGREIISWPAGWTYVGNGVLGAANNVYFQPAGSATIVTAGGNPAHVPVAGSDTLVGSTVVADVEKHYARKVIHRCWLELESLHPATTNDMVAFVAPIRGPGNVSASVAATGVAVGSSAASLASIQGNLKVASYEDCKLEMTPYIAGGSGGKQDEFNISGATNVSTVLGATNDELGVVPCAFVVGGTCSTAGLQGLQVHLVRIYQEIELLDYLGAALVSDPIAFYAGQIEKYQGLMSHYLKMKTRWERPVVTEFKVSATCRQLFDLRRRMDDLGTSIPESAYCPDGCPGCVQRKAAYTKRP